eukprot:g30993.t1
MQDEMRTTMFMEDNPAEVLPAVGAQVQEPLLSKWGFDPSEEGLAEMMVCLSDHTFKDSSLRKLADETTKMLYGGEDGMWGMED